MFHRVIQKITLAQFFLRYGDIEYRAAYSGFAGWATGSCTSDINCRLDWAAPSLHNKAIISSDIHHTHIINT